MGRQIFARACGLQDCDRCLYSQTSQSTVSHSQIAHSAFPFRFKHQWCSTDPETWKERSAAFRQQIPDIREETSSLKLPIYRNFSIFLLHERTTFHLPELLFWTNNLDFFFLFELIWQYYSLLVWPPCINIVLDKPTVVCVLNAFWMNGPSLA